MTGRLPATDMIARVAVHLLERGQTLRDVAEVWGVSRQAINQLVGRLGRKLPADQLATMRRVMRRLWAAPYRWPCRVIGEVWGLPGRRVNDILNR